MKNLFRIALIKSLSLCHSETGKLLCQVLSATKSKSPRPAVVSSKEYFTSNHQLALYLNRSDAAAYKYRYKGYIPFLNEGGRILVKKSDVDHAVKLNPHLASVTPLHKRPAASRRIFTRIIETDNKNTVIHFTYQGRECFILVSRKKAEKRNVVYSLCRELIALLHQIKPFKIAPDNIRMAA